ncbi:MAG TPA: Asp-tRNA(Asn)/Glu-tRNA(Gln) amidotransferase subunit GatC [Thermoanaerobaculia bacterium]|nr:Asp-tRNA(Asn)/Glu-tRNA(Gln) amidotransferase subunit GatC [Thermoanaerobaculia bacterium]
MELTIEEVRKIAALARLRLKPEEEAVFVGQLGKIVGYIDQLQRYETGSESDAALAVREADREAEDIPHECLPRDQFLANAPAAMDGFLLVPEVKKTGGEVVDE